MSGTVERFDNRFIYVNLGSIEAQLSKQDQIPGEVFQSHDRIEVFVYKVEDNPRGVNVFVSRSPSRNDQTFDGTRNSGSLRMERLKS